VLRPIFALVIYDCSYVCRLLRNTRATYLVICLLSIDCSFFREQRSVDIAYIELCHLWEIAFSS